MSESEAERTVEFIMRQAVEAGMSASVWADGHIDGGRWYANWGGYRNEASGDTMLEAVERARQVARGLLPTEYHD